MCDASLRRPARPSGLGPSAVHAGTARQRSGQNGGCVKYATADWLLVSGTQLLQGAGAWRVVRALVTFRAYGDGWRVRHEGDFRDLANGVDARVPASGTVTRPIGGR